METQSIIRTAKTVDEAIELALLELGVGRDEVEVDIVSGGRAGILGIGAEDAKVRVTPIGAGAGAGAGLAFIAGMYLVSSYLLFRVHMPRLQGALGSGLQNIAQGVRYVRSNHVFAFLILMAYVWGFFGQAYTALLPVFAVAIDPESSGFVLGTLFSISGLGGIIGALIAGSLRSVVRPGLIIIAMGVSFGVTLAGFAYSPWYWLTLLMMMLAVMSHEIFGVTAVSIIQRRVDDQYRGRVMGLWTMQFSVLHSLGNLQIGLLAVVLGAPAALAIAAAVVAAFAIFVAGSNRQIRGLRHEPLPATGDAAAGQLFSDFRGGKKACFRGLTHPPFIDLKRPDHPRHNPE